MTIETYRTRIYRHYVQTGGQSLAPQNLRDLAPRAPYLRRLIREHFPADRDAAVLDVGCGYGALLHFAREAGYRQLRGVDGAAGQVAAARQLGIVGVEEGDLLEVLRNQPSASLDVVIAFDVIEHFTRDELLPFVDDARRVLKPGGRWIIHVPNAESPMGMRVRYGDLTHELAFTTSSLGQLLLSSGFSSLRCHEDTPVVHGAKSAARWLLWKLLRAVLRIYLAAETGGTGKDCIFSQNLLAVAVK